MARFWFVQACEKPVDGFQLVSARNVQTRVGVRRLHAAV